MGAQLDRLRYEVFQNLFYSPMNTGILRAAVATAPTVYGIETQSQAFWEGASSGLQQHLPFTVLKRKLPLIYHGEAENQVATAPTVYGIETSCFYHLQDFKLILLQQHLPFTVLKRLYFFI